MSAIPTPDAQQELAAAIDAALAAHREAQPGSLAWYGALKAAAALANAYRNEWNARSEDADIATLQDIEGMIRRMLPASRHVKDLAEAIGAISFSLGWIIYRRKYPRHVGVDEAPPPSAPISPQE